MSEPALGAVALRPAVSVPVSLLASWDVFVLCYLVLGWVLIALQNAFHELLHAAGPAEGVARTVARGGDTDTNACIAGALLGAAHGADAWPASWKAAILSCRAEAGRLGVLRPRPRCLWPVDLLQLADRLVLLGEKAG